jgi:uncharacterized protein (TIGR03435 family)
MTPLFNHLWQSTLFAAAMAALSLAFRNNHARTRYALWLAASLKFLVPFSMLVSIGDLAQLRTAPVPRQTAEYFTKAVESVSQPFATPVIAHQAAAGSQFSYLPALVLAIWCVGFVAILLTWFRRYRRVTTAVRAARPLPLESEVPVRSTALHLEPGIFGILRPILLLPDGITDRLTAQQLTAILTHEMCHVRRRDNLTSVLHMAVQSIFWFHPLVWWIGARLIEERERACDEEVLSLGNPSRVYAEGMLNVCKFYLESPVPCVSGVTGGELRKRIEEIMSNRIALRLPAAKKLLLAAAGFATIAGPLVIGLLQAPLGWAQTVSIPPDANPPLTFEVVAIKPADPNTQGGGIRMLPGGGLNFANISAHFILTFAYDIRDFQLFGEPGWMKTERFDIKTKGDGTGPDPSRPPSDAEFRKFDYANRQRTRSMLAERFQLKFHRETRELPVYALVLAKGGHKMKANDGDAPMNMRMNRGQLTSQRMPIQNLCNALANQLGRPVVNHTGLDGNFDYKLEWTPDPSPSIPGDSGEGAAAADPGGPSLAAALLEQLGLRLESKKAPVEVIVIDRVTKPTEN